MGAEIYLCPYCEKEMEKGLFMSRGANYFLPDGEKTPATNLEGSIRKRNGIPLPPDLFAIGRPEWPQAYVCRSCKVIIMPYTE